MIAICVAILSDRVRERREALAYTQEQLADLAGVGQSSVARIESGETPSPRLNTLAAIATALKVSVSWLQGVEGLDVPAPEPANQLPPSTVLSDLNPPSLGHIPGWADLERAAKKKAPDIDAWAWDELRNANPLITNTITLTVSSVVQMARLVLEHGKPPATQKK